MRNRIICLASVLMGVLICPGPARADTPASVEIAVRLSADPGIPRLALETAKPCATRVYRRIGIELRWVAEDMDADVIARIIPSAFERVDPLAMGVTPRTIDGPGHVVYGFYDRIEAFATRHGQPVALILGHVMAHELGHLLLPRGSHSLAGIMATRWNRIQIGQIERGSLSFTREEAGKIRARARTLFGPG